MKKLLVIALPILLAACTHGVPSDASEGEVAMAEMMGITVQELRSQTPEEHMRMMQEMMHQGSESDGFMAGEGIDISSLPEAQGSQVIEVSDGDVIELNPMLVRKEVAGTEMVMYGYNGQIPGPQIKAPQGSTFTVNVTNQIDLPTTVHWHGLRHNFLDDGMPGISQEPIEPGESHTYTVHVPDAGLFWYHPHVREDIQQELGMYGALLVIPPNDSETHHEVLVLDDIQTDFGVAPEFGKEGPDQVLMGRFGNRMFVNGSTEGHNLLVPVGTTRLYVLNAANTRTFNLNFGGAKINLLASDLSSYETKEVVDSVLLGPAERAIIEVDFESTEDDYPILHSTPNQDYVLGFVTAEAEVGSELELAADQSDIGLEQFKAEFDRPVDKTLRLNIELKGDMAHMDHSDMMHMDESGIEWEDTMPGMNLNSNDDNTEWQLIDEATGEVNGDIDWSFAQGDIVKIRIVNDAKSDHPMQHPIHLHGQRFLVLDQDGGRQTNLAWKDTVLVPTGATYDILVDMSNPGTWMLHCHIAEHAENGMMFMFEVLPNE